MPNWAESKMSVVLPTENAGKFESLFWRQSGLMEDNKDLYLEPFADYIGDCLGEMEM